MAEPLNSTALAEGVVHFLALTPDPPTSSTGPLPMLYTHT